MELKVESLSFLDEATYDLDGISIFHGEGGKEAIGQLAKASLDSLFDETGKRRLASLQAIRALVHYYAKDKGDLKALRKASDSFLLQANGEKDFGRAIKESGVGFLDETKLEQALSLLFSSDIESLWSFDSLFEKTLKSLPKARLALTKNTRIAIEDGGKRALIYPNREGESGLVGGKVIDLASFRNEGAVSPVESYFQAKEGEGYGHYGSEDIEREFKLSTPFAVSESGAACLNDEELPLEALFEGDKTFFALLKAFRSQAMEKGGYVYCEYPEIGLEGEGLIRLTNLLASLHRHIGVNFLLISSSKELIDILTQSGAKAIEVKR